MIDQALRKLSMLFPRRRRTIDLRISTEVNQTNRALYAGSQPDDEAQWFYLTCTSALRTLGYTRAASVTDHGQTIEFACRLKVAEGIPTALVIEAISRRIPHANVWENVTPLTTRCCTAA